MKELDCLFFIWHILLALIFSSWNFLVLFNLNFLTSYIFLIYIILILKTLVFSRWNLLPFRSAMKLYVCMYLFMYFKPTWLVPQKLMIWNEMRMVARSFSCLISRKEKLPVDNLLTQIWAWKLFGLVVTVHPLSVSQLCNTLPLEYLWQLTPKEMSTFKDWFFCLFKLSRGW